MVGRLGRSAPIVFERDVEPYTLTTYEMGDCFDAYGDIFDLALREPGLVILQDLTLYDFYSAGAGVRHQLLADEVRYAHGDAGVKMWEQAYARRRGVDGLKYHLLRRLATDSRALISHSAWGRDRLHAVASATPVYHIPLAADEPSLTLANSVEAAALQSALRLPDRPSSRVSFGT